MNFSIFLSVYSKEKESYCRQSHKKCFFTDKRNDIFLGKKIMTQKLTGIDKWIKDCLYCGEPLLVKNYRDAVKDHYHVTGNTVVLHTISATFYCE